MGLYELRSSLSLLDFGTGTTSVVFYFSICLPVFQISFNRFAIFVENSVDRCFIMSLLMKSAPGVVLLSSK